MGDLADGQTALTQKFEVEFEIFAKCLQCTICGAALGRKGFEPQLTQLPISIHISAPYPRTQDFMDPLTASASDLLSSVVANIAPLKYTKLTLRVHQRARNCISIRRRPSREFHFSANNDEYRPDATAPAFQVGYARRSATPGWVALVA